MATSQGLMDYSAVWHAESRVCGRMWGAPARWVGGYSFFFPGFQYPECLKVRVLSLKVKGIWWLTLWKQHNRSTKTHRSAVGFFFKKKKTLWEVAHLVQGCTVKDLFPIWISADSISARTPTLQGGRWEAQSFAEVCWERVGLQTQSKS